MTGKNPNDTNKNPGNNPNPTKPEISRDASRSPAVDAPRNPPSTQQRDKNPSGSHESDTRRDATQRGMPDQGKERTDNKTNAQQGQGGQHAAQSGQAGQTGQTGQTGKTGQTGQGGHNTQRDQGTTSQRGESAVDRGTKAKTDDEACDVERKDEKNRVNDASRRTAGGNKGQERMNEDAAG